ncbi:MAG: hypothetical protein WC997_18225 [Porticoccaceae bacterium]
MATSTPAMPESDDMPRSRCNNCQEITASGKMVCDYCGYWKSVPTPKTGSSIPFLVTLIIVLSLGFYIASSRSYSDYCDPSISHASGGSLMGDGAGYCSPLKAR